MKAAYLEKVGPPENIIFGDLPDPQPAGSQVLVKVAAVDVNPIDTRIRAGAVSMPLPLPFIVGCDLAGNVAAVGPEAGRFRVGDRVWGSNQGMMGRQGTFAEFAAVDEQWLYPLPVGVNEEQAAAVSLVGITARLGLVRDARLRTGETLFVNGGSGGVGSMVVQMAKALGARVVTTAGEATRSLGVLPTTARGPGHRTKPAKTIEDVPARIKEFSPAGVNVYWETTSEPNFERAIDLLAPRGRMILMAGRAARPTFPVGPFYVKGCSLYGFAMFNATPDEQRAAADDINRWLVSGQLHANIDRILPLSETAAAHRLQEESTIGKSGALKGKIVLKP